jgi:hypothetical protein
MYRNQPRKAQSKAKAIDLRVFHMVAITSAAALFLAIFYCL